MTTSTGLLEATLVLTCLAFWARRKHTKGGFRTHDATTARITMHLSKWKLAIVMMKTLNGIFNNKIY
jgi:hypothetical protein